MEKTTAYLQNEKSVYQFYSSCGLTTTAIMMTACIFFGNNIENIISSETFITGVVGSFSLFMLKWSTSCWEKANEYSAMIRGKERRKMMEEKGIV